MKSNLFLKALKNKFRFDTSIGSLNTEQLFQLGKKQLDALYISLNNDSSNSQGLLKNSESNRLVKDKLEIVSTIFQMKVKDEEKANERAKNRQLQQTLLNAAAIKEVEELTEGKTSEELQKAARKLKV